MSSTYPEIPAIEAIRTTRSMRRLETRPIPDDVLLKILDAAIRAPSGSNQQSWSFIVVTDNHLKQEIQKIYYDVAQKYFQAGPTTISDGSGQETMNRVRSSAGHLAEYLHEAPVLVFACIKGARSFTLGSSIYPAVQNLMIAARAYGIGTTLTTFHLSRESEIKELLGIPEGVHTAALIPMGYPTGNWGESKRRPVEEVTFLNSFGSPYDGS